MSSSPTESTDPSPGKQSSDSSSSSNNDSSSSSSWWPSWYPFSPANLKAKFQEFDDQQRIDRLSECRKLDKILSDCRKRHPPGKSKSKKDSSKINHKDDPIESVSIGVRNMKYFGWRGILQSTASLEEETDNDSDSSGAQNDKPDLSVFHPKIKSSCAREEHAVWACRAIATGCGKDLGELKKCFENIHNGSPKNPEQSQQLPPHVHVLTAPYTNYQGLVEKVGSSSNTDATHKIKQQIPCHEIQQRLGSCVSENGRQLLERKQQRERRQQ